MRSTAVVLDMLFGQRDLYDRLMSELRDGDGLESHVIRGRVRADAAWLKLELRGATWRVQELIRRWMPSILSVTPLPQSAA